jgi:membrane-associated phospholipid phosphatase
MNDNGSRPEAALRVLALLFVLLGLEAAAAGESAATTTDGVETSPPDAPPAGQPGCLTPSTAKNYVVHTYPRRLAATVKGTYTGLSLLGLAIAGGVVPLLDDYDEEVRSDVLADRPPYGFIEAGEVLGSPPALFGAALAVAAAGCLAGSDEILATGATMLEALSVAGASTIALKLAVHRERPDGSDHLSFPSNHASGSFAVASVLAYRHGWWLGVPALLAAGFVSWARMAADKHFMTDTFFGAAIGTASGLAAARAQPATSKESERTGAGPAPSSSAAVVPVVLASGGGLAVAARW